MGAIIIPRLEGETKSETQILVSCFLSSETGSIWARIEGLDQERSWTNLSGFSVKTPFAPGIISVLFLSSCLAEPHNDYLEGFVPLLLGSVGDGHFTVRRTVMCSKFSKKIVLLLVRLTLVDTMHPRNDGLVGRIECEYQVDVR